MGEKDAIHIGTCFDLGYLSAAEVMLFSVLGALEGDRDRLQVHLICPPEDLPSIRDSITATLGLPERQLHCYGSIPRISAVLERHSDCGHITPTTYLRLDYSELLDPSIPKLIHLDPDIVVRHSLRDLWETDLEEKTIGAVEDVLSYRKDLYYLNPRIRLGMHRESPYFNAGVLVVDLVRWRNRNLRARIDSVMAERIETLQFNEQDLLNVVVEGDWKALDPTWNAMSGFFHKKAALDQRFGPEVKDRLKRDPSLIHFDGFPKPWHGGCRHPLRSAYYEALRRFLANARNAGGAPADPADTVSVLCAVRDRIENLLRSIPTWLRVPEISEIVIVDWSSKVPVRESIARFSDPRIRIVEVSGEEGFNSAEALNLAARISTGRWLLRLDADIQISIDALRNHPPSSRTFYTGDFRQARDFNEYGLDGVLLVERASFFLVNGFCEELREYGFEDQDLVERLASSGLKRVVFGYDYFYHQPHDATTRLTHRGNLFPEIPLPGDFLRVVSLKFNGLLLSHLKYSRETLMRSFEITESAGNYLGVRMGERTVREAIPDPTRTCLLRLSVARALHREFPAMQGRELERYSLDELTEMARTVFASPGLALEWKARSHQRDHLMKIQTSPAFADRPRSQQWKERIRRVLAVPRRGIQRLQGSLRGSVNREGVTTAQEAAPRRWHGTPGNV